MLTYNDCLALSELAPEEVAAIARHEHLPEIVALEMGWCLCRTPEGKHLIRRMILDDIEAACRRGDTRTAARLGLVLHHFLGTHPDRQGPAESHAGDDRLTQAPRLDAAATARMRGHVGAYLAAMLRHFGMDPASAQDRFPDQMQAAELCCAACTETGRCRRFLSGLAGAEAPSAFCPNAALLDALGRLSRNGGAGAISPQGS
ncbi:DUF6455 family protein [Siccirubricoccus sp. G192]|uniref:DUF6455 family protein n=1 Tax=Siccirubricoccus sp. G192 TaxID=2849651 RepID=UPI001C2C2BE7|nr:DUF6455 family protein [Siccirubricoccus sp. G192]MBV1795943.1 hypothetical protein [Siccirubricoccus sp. G192]